MCEIGSQYPTKAPERVHISFSVVHVLVPLLYTYAYYSMAYYRMFLLATVNAKLCGTEAMTLIQC